LVRAAGPLVCVFPINGTRRWFILEHEESRQNIQQAYSNAAGERHVELCKMCFDHGLDTLVTPVLNSKHAGRSGEYMKKIGAESLTLVANHPAYLSFYEEYQVRVRFYGDFRKHLAGTAYEYVCDEFDNLARLTSSNNRHRLFFGFFADDAAESIANLAIRHFRATGETPTREKLVELYYGEFIEPASLFIGFSKLRVYDYPLLNLGQENLYFMVAPSLYMTEQQLRAILYDHTCLRRIEEENYADLTEMDFRSMKNFYQSNRETTLGIGESLHGIWTPILHR
jgi:tuberculosinol/isotuberculosinol synthase